MSGPHQPARHRAGTLAALEDRPAGDQRRFIAFDMLHETAAAGRHVVDEFRLAHFETVEIDHVNVGAQLRRQPAAVAKAEEIGGLAGLTLD